MQTSLRVHALSVLVSLSALGVITPGRADGQEPTGSIEGKVTQAENGRPVAGARLHVAGLTIRAVTNEAGEYRIGPLPARQVELTVRMIGFAPVTKRVIVAEGQTASANFEVTVSALQLDQVVVTGTGQQVEARKLGNTIAVITPPENTYIRNLSSLLQGKEPGLTAITSSGLTGTGARIREPGGGDQIGRAHV